MGMSVTISAATAQDAEQILKLQYLCYQSEAETYGDYSIEPLTQTLDALRLKITEGPALVARLGDEVVASVRGGVDAAGTARISKLIVHPRMQRHGLGGRLLAAIEAQFASERAAGASGCSPATAARPVCGCTAASGTPVVTVPAGSALRTVTLEKDAGAAQETYGRGPMRRRPCCLRLPFGCTGPTQPGHAEYREDHRDEELADPVVRPDRGVREGAGPASVQVPDDEDADQLGRAAHQRRPAAFSPPSRTSE